MVRCPVLTSEYIGSDSACICRKDVARKLGVICPREKEPYFVKKTCFDLQELLKNRFEGKSPSREEIDALMKPQQISTYDPGKPGPALIVMGRGGQ